MQPVPCRSLTSTTAMLETRPELSVTSTPRPRLALPATWRWPHAWYRQAKDQKALLLSCPKTEHRSTAQVHSPSRPLPPPGLPGIRQRTSGSWDHHPAAHSPGAQGKRLVGWLRPEAWESPSRAGLHRQNRGAGRPASSLPEEPKDPRPGAHSPCLGSCHLDWPSCGPNVHLFRGDERLALRDAP